MQGWREGRGRLGSGRKEKGRWKKIGETHKGKMVISPVGLTLLTLKLDGMAYASTNFECMAYRYLGTFHGMYVTGIFLNGMYVNDSHPLVDRQCSTVESGFVGGDFPGSDGDAEATALQENNFSQLLPFSSGIFSDSNGEAGETCPGVEGQHIIVFFM
jgi:hypothetical protein